MATDDDGNEYVDYVMVTKGQLESVERGLGKINDYVDMVANGELEADPVMMSETSSMLAFVRALLLEQAAIAPIRVPIFPKGPPPSGPDLKLVG